MSDGTGSDGQAQGQGGGETDKEKVTIPSIKNVNDLSDLVTDFQANSGEGKARMFTRGGFKDWKGINSLPPATLSSMIGACGLALATQAEVEGDNGKEASKQLTIANEFLGKAREDAGNARRLQAYRDIASDLGVDDRKSGENITDFIARVTEGMVKKQQGKGKASAKA